MLWLPVFCWLAGQGATDMPLPPPPLGLEPRDVAVLANSQFPGSVEVAEHYCEKRGVPKSNIIQLDLPTTEECTRADFNNKLRDPLRRALQSIRPQPRVLLTVHGVPLRVLAATPTAADNQRRGEKEKEQAGLQKQMSQATAEFQAADRAHILESTPENLRKKESAQRALQTLQTRARRLADEILILSATDSVAAVDSELALLHWGNNYPLARWVINPWHWQAPLSLRAQFPELLLVSRIDGPSVALCKRIIDDAVATEATGLEGDAWIDSRRIMYKPLEDPSGTGYGGYDESLRELCNLIRDHTKLTAHIDVWDPLFPPGTCKNCALYCGWYSHAQFVDCCVFRRGAIAVHIASSEAISLRDPKCTFWCKNLLEKGACATLGPVAEPYLFSFPRPAEFFGFILTGKYTLVECYFRTIAVNSWQQTLIGDPLYKPYAKKPMLKVEDIKPSPADAKRLF